MKDANDMHRAGINLREYADGAKPYKPKGERAEAPKVNGASSESVAIPSLKQWLARKIAPRDLLCGSFLSTTCRIIITGRPGWARPCLESP